MTLSPASGSPDYGAATPFSITTHTAGDVIALFVVNFNDTTPATALSSSRVTWTVWVAGTVVGNYAITLFKGVVNSVGTDSVSVTATDTTTGLRTGAKEFATTAGAANVVIADHTTLDTTGTAWPALTASVGDLYVGFELNDGAASAGATSGYTYDTGDPNGNGLAYSVRGSAGATHPVWADSDLRDVMAVLLREQTASSHTASASLTVTPGFSAVPSARSRSASLTVTPVLSASAASIPDNALLLEDGTPILLEDGTPLLDESPGGTTRTAAASLTVTPSFSASPHAAHVASASLTVTPSFSAARAASFVRSASLTVTPSFDAEGTSAAPTFSRSASLAVTPSFSAAAQRTGRRSASLTVTPTFTAAATVTRFRSASLTVTPTFTATRQASHVAHASLTVTPTFSATRHAAHVVTASLTVRPSLTASAEKAEGAPPGYPDGDLGAMVELLFDGTWTDITTVALPDGQQFGSIKSGQPDGAQQPSPAAMNGLWDNPDGDLSPRNSAGPHFGQLRQNTPARVSFTSPYGGYLRLEADNSDRAFVNDTSALHVTGSLELRLEVTLSDYRPCVLAGRLDNTQPSWVWQLNSDGTLTFSWWDSGGTQRSVTSNGAAAVSWRAFRVTFNASNGTATFYVSGSIDGTWTQLGDALSGTSGASTTVRAGNAPLVVGWSNSLASSQMRGQAGAFRLYSGIGGTKVADASFSTQVPGSTSFTDFAGLSWSLAGGAELTSRDYRLHGELSSLQPTAQVSGNVARVQAALSGRLRRLQQGAAPTAESAIRRAILAQTGTLAPVSYWPMEDGTVSKTFGPAAGAQLMTAELGTVRPAADSSFEASGALPTLNGDSLSATVDTYTGATAFAVRFLYKQGTSLPASGSTPLIEITTTGACTHLTVSVNTDGTLNFSGKLSSGSSAFSATELSYPQTAGPSWWSVECTTVSGGVQYALVAVAPGASSGNTQPETVTGHGSFGNVTAITVNSGLALSDSVFGHLSVQKAWASMFTLGAPLNAWRGELAGDRFARVCAENGITCRVIGRPSSFAALGPQPRGSVWTILRDCVQTEQGLIFEPMGCFGLGIRSRESMGIQAAGLTLDFSASNLPGDLQPVDDDSGFLNDVTGSTPGGTSWREVLDDGSAKSVSEPEDGGMGRYAGQVPYPLNVAADGSLASAVAFYLKRVSVDEPRFRNVAADFGIPGAPVADIARLRPGDLIQVVNVPGIYQDSDIKVLAVSATETFGPGRKLAWDCVPWSPYGT